MNLSLAPRARVLRPLHHVSARSSEEPRAYVRLTVPKYPSTDASSGAGCSARHSGDREARRLDKHLRTMRRRSVWPVLTTCVVLLGCSNDDGNGRARNSTANRLDGQPDCNHGEPWVAEASLDPEAPGHPTAKQAVREFLEQWHDQFGGEVAIVRDGVGALLIDGSEVVVAVSFQTAAGGFLVDRSTGCDGYEPDVLPGPP